MHYDPSNAGPVMGFTLIWLIFAAVVASMSRPVRRLAWPEIQELPPFVEDEHWSPRPVVNAMLEGPRPVPYSVMLEQRRCELLSEIAGYVQQVRVANIHGSAVGTHVTISEPPRAKELPQITPLRRELVAAA